MTDRNNKDSQQGDHKFLRYTSHILDVQHCIIFTTLFVDKNYPNHSNMFICILRRAPILRADVLKENWKTSRGLL